VEDALAEDGEGEVAAVAERLLVVADAFVAKGAGIVVMPRFTAAAPPKGRFTVELRFADGTIREVAAEVDVAHMRGPLPPFAMYRLHGLTPEEVPAGTEIWSVP
jgi:DNA-binding transcriptional LysR family regulator